MITIDPLFVENKITPLKAEEAFYYLKLAWELVLGEKPTQNQLGIVWSQFWLESASGTKCQNFNYGNIKRHPGELWTMFPCHEYNSQGIAIKYYPPDPQTHFSAYPDPLTGAKAYLIFLRDRKIYIDAWKGLMAGDPKAYIHGLVSGKYKYFTAPEDKYLARLLEHLNIFNKNYSFYLQYLPPQNPDSEPILAPPSFPSISEYKQPVEPTQELKLSFWDSIFITLRNLLSLK